MSNIGRWFSRMDVEKALRLTRAHRCDSEIADRLVTRCGRQMRYRADQPWMFQGPPGAEAVDYYPADACEQCLGMVR